MIPYAVLQQKLVFPSERHLLRMFNFLDLGLDVPPPLQLITKLEILNLIVNMPSLLLLSMRLENQIRSKLQRQSLPKINSVSFFDFDFLNSLFT